MTWIHIRIIAYVYIYIYIRLETLLAVAEDSSLNNVELYLAGIAVHINISLWIYIQLHTVCKYVCVYVCMYVIDWGYNTEEQRAIGRNHNRIQLIGIFIHPWLFSSLLLLLLLLIVICVLHVFKSDVSKFQEIVKMVSES